MGETIHQEATGTGMCPVKALARVVYTILQDGGTTYTLFCEFKRNNKWEHVQLAVIIVVVHTVTKQMELRHQGIGPDLVGSHSLQEGGAVALKLHGYDDTTIKNSSGGLVSPFYNIFTIKFHIYLKIFPKNEHCTPFPQYYSH